MNTRKFEENDILYFQDFNFYRGIPAGVEFEVHTFGMTDRVKLVAPGYGGKPYGAGALFVLLKDLEGK